MKMKTNNLPAVLLAVIMAALMILTSGLFDQAHADTDYWVEITPEAETWVALPGDTIPVSAKVYYDFDGENIEDQSDLDFRWTLDDDGTEFASIKVDSMNSARAKVKFKTLPPEQTEIDAYVDVVVNVFSDGHKVGSGMINLRVSSDYYRVYPDIVNQYLPVGESEELIASVYHYSLDDHEGTGTGETTVGELSGISAKGFDTVSRSQTLSKGRDLREGHRQHHSWRDRLRAVGQW